MVKKARNTKKACKPSSQLKVSVDPSDQAVALRKGIQFLSKHRTAQSGLFSPVEQPFDQELLSHSTLYRKSRQVYLASQGSFIPTLLSSPRTLSSVSLLKHPIEYSPIEKELIWAANDPIQKRQPGYLIQLRGFVTNLFHEQNHRILWGFLPSPPSTSTGIRKYLNLVESFVVILDMALADELGPELAPLFHLCGMIYDPGTDVKILLKNKRTYRNYLQAALYGTYLNLELYDPEDIKKVIAKLFPLLQEFSIRAANRSVQLAREFVMKTNPNWQRLHKKAVIQSLSRPGTEPLDLSSDPFDNRLPYLWTEKWLDLMGL